MPLTTEQQLLLHAHLDGECRADELPAVRCLLASPETGVEAASYVSEINRLRVLVRDCASVIAPEDLRRRVLAQVRQGRVHTLPNARWIALAAASIAIAAGLITWNAWDEGPAVQRPNSHTVARVAPPPADLPAPETETALQDKMTWPEPALQPREVISLDRGAPDAPFEILVEFNRDSSAGVLQVYTDLLNVASLHGDAALLDGNPAPTFSGHDFGECSGLQVWIPETRVAGLLRSMQALADAQVYGAMLIPNDLRRTAASAMDATVSATPSAWMPITVDAEARKADRRTPARSPNTLIVIKLR